MQGGAMQGGVLLVQAKWVRGRGVICSCCSCPPFFEARVLCAHHARQAGETGRAPCWRSTGYLHPPCSLLTAAVTGITQAVWRL